MRKIWYQRPLIYLIRCKSGITLIRRSPDNTLSEAVMLPIFLLLLDYLHALIYGLHIQRNHRMVAFGQRFIQCFI